MILRAPLRVAELMRGALDYTIRQYYTIRLYHILLLYQTRMQYIILDYAATLLNDDTALRGRSDARRDIS